MEVLKKNYILKKVFFKLRLKTCKKLLRQGNFPTNLIKSSKIEEFFVGWSTREHKHTYTQTYIRTNTHTLTHKHISTVTHTNTQIHNHIPFKPRKHY